MSNRNRTAGHNWERKCIQLLKAIFPFLVTARSESKARDDAKVDLMNKDEYKNGRVPYNFQCKTTVNLNYAKELEKMPDDEYVNVILHKKTKKSKEGKKFMEVGQYAILELDDFIEIMRQAEEYRKHKRIIDLYPSGDIEYKNLTYDEIEKKIEEAIGDGVGGMLIMPEEELKKKMIEELQKGVDEEETKGWSGID